MVNMNRFISCLLYLCLLIPLSCGSSSKSVHSSTYIRRLQQTEQNQNLLNNNRNPIHIITLTNTTNTTNTTSNPDNYFCGSSVDSAMALCKPCPTGTLDECMKYSHEFACIKGIDSCAHGNPASNPVPSPTPPTTHAPTKKYIPAPPDDEESEIEKEATKIGWLFLYIVIIFAFIWVVIYYREAIFYFARNAYSNTRRHGCKGFVYSFLPCLAGSLSRGSDGPILDQIIFETEDPNAPLVGE